MPMPEKGSIKSAYQLSKQTKAQKLLDGVKASAENKSEPELKPEPEQQ